MEANSVDRSSFIVSLIENRAKEVGLAAFDLRTAALHLSQFIETSRSYQNTKTLLYFYDPTDIIIPPTKMSSDGMIGVSALVDCFYSLANKVIMMRGCFDDSKGAILVKSLAAKEPSALSLDNYSKQYYLCLAAAAAIVKWVESEKGVSISNNSLVVTFNGSYGHMSIDSISVENLELIEPLALMPGIYNKRNSLFRMLKSTRTVGGSRLLRANLLQPLKDVETINARLDCLDELSNNEKLFFGICQVLQKFPKDIDRVLCHFCFTPKKVSINTSNVASARRSQNLVASIIFLRDALAVLPLLRKALLESKSFLLRKIYDSICENKKYDLLKSRIEEIIDEDVLQARSPFIIRTQHCFAVKPGIDGHLDVARKSFCNTSEAIHALANRYREEMNLPNLKLPYNNRQGFYISIPEKDIVEDGLPKIFIQVVKQGKNIHCSSQELISLNIRNKSAATECYIRTEHCLEGLLNAIQETISILTLLSESICLLDMIVNSFAYTILSKPIDHYTRPEFTDNGPIAIESGRHLVMESINQEEFVANNTFLSDASNMIIVMGPNMSGKSTYLCQVGLIVILSQVGCYVPARFASLRVVDHLFTRIGTAESLESNSSTVVTDNGSAYKVAGRLIMSHFPQICWTPCAAHCIDLLLEDFAKIPWIKKFMTEMKETSFIMQNVTPRSLILIDELGNSTSSLDGLAIAWSCCEYLLSLKAYTIFATHIECFSEIVAMYPNVRVCHFQVNVKNDRLDFKFTLKEGVMNIPQYGLLLAGISGLPKSVVEEAKHITHKITELDTERLEIYKMKYISLQQEYRVVQRLLCLNHGNLAEEELRVALQNLKEGFAKGGLHSI